ncbi:hypothetical protein GCM10027318_06640 [Massilia agilis]
MLVKVIGVKLDTLADPLGSGGFGVERVQPAWPAPLWGASQVMLTTVGSLDQKRYSTVPDTVRGAA